MKEPFVVLVGVVAGSRRSFTNAILALTLCLVVTTWPSYGRVDRAESVSDV